MQNNYARLIEARNALEQVNHNPTLSYAVLSGFLMAFATDEQANKVIELMEQHTQAQQAFLQMEIDLNLPKKKGW
jgi:hypothetical protein